jgi:ribonucleoside-diphosphate reductase alpha chain
MYETKTFTYEEALQKCIEYFNGDDLAASVFLSKYALTNLNGEILEETPDAMHRRLAKEFARIEKKYPNPMSEEEIFELFKNFRYIVPQGSPMAGIGNPYQDMSLSNCFVVESPWDSYSGIMKTDQEEAQIMKRRGGVGFDISTIRPKGLPTKNAAKTTDGIGVFMERFSNTCREVAQGGRRGALMLTISVHHPEIRTFINIKRDLKKVTGANISVRLSDEFMNAVKNNSRVELRWPVDSPNPKVREMVDANELWTQIIESAHASAEPGLLFWDTIMKRTPAHCYPDFISKSTNPCGELLLSPYDSCRLLLVNVVSFVENPFTPQARFNIEKYGEVCQKAQRLMDDMIDLELECLDRIINKIKADPEPEDVKQIEFDLWHKIRKACVNGRRTGTGVTAVGDAVAALNVVYGSPESIDIVETIYRELALNTYRSTVQMAKERGPFPVYDYNLEKDHEFINQIMDLDPQLRADWKAFGRRNIALTTTAPAGSVSVLTQTTSGIEPAFLLHYKRRKKINPSDKVSKVDFVDPLGDKWSEFDVYHHWFKKWMEITGKTKIEESPYFGATSNDINWVNKVKAQAAAQRWVCHSISNTTNVPNNTSVDVIKEIYMTGWESGTKGVTVYRDGCRSGVLVSTDSDSQKEKNAGSRAKFVTHDAPKRPKEMPCDIHSITVGGEKWTLFVGKLEDKPYEIMGGLSKFVKIPKRVKTGKIVKHNGAQNPVARYDLHYDFEKGPEDEAIIKDITNVFDNATHAAFTRTISLALRHGTPVQYVVEQIQKGSEKEDDLFSFSRAMARVLKTYIADGTKVTSDKTCPECHSQDLVYQEGCVTCKACGYSKCK